MEQNTKSLSDYLDLIKRRKKWIIVPFLLITIAAVLVAYNLPRTYRSTATMLMETPSPTKVIESTVAQYADEQIQSISQRVITNDRVLSIIQSHDLYTEAKGGLNNYELAEIFREKTEVKLVASTLIGRATSGMSEIAFTISFTHNDAVKARDIANTLATLFIEENDRARTQRAVKATEFLTNESEKLNKEIQDIDGKIADYKEKYNYSLPEQSQANLAAIDRTENEIRDTDNQIRSTKDRISFLAAELARRKSEVPDILDDKAPHTKEDTLKILQAQYLRLSSIYSPSHPSLVRLKREIQALNPGFEGVVSQADIATELDEAKRELRVLEETYAGDHPDIAKKAKQVQTLEQQFKSGVKPADQNKILAPRSQNAAQFNLEEQYRSSQSELQYLMQKKEDLKAKLESLHTRVSLAPQVEIGYLDLIRERESSIKKYNQLKEKLQDAKLLQKLEEEQQGQNLTMIEKPIVPAHPEKGIRRKVALMGVALALAVGFGAAFLVEFLDPGLRGYRAVMEISGLMPLVVIPYIESPSETEARLIEKRKNMQRLIWSSLVGILLIGIAVIGYFLY